MPTNHSRTSLALLAALLAAFTMLGGTAALLSGSAALACPTPCRLA